MNTEASILICVENINERTKICDFLKSIGFSNLTTAESFNEVEESIRSGEFGVAVIDGSFDGASAAQLIRMEKRRSETIGTQLPKFVVISRDQSRDPWLFENAAVVPSGCSTAELLKPILDAANSLPIMKKNEALLKDDEHLEVRISSILHNVGIPAHIKGYTYLRSAIMMTVKDPDVINFVTKSLYPSVAAQCQTTSTRVERAIRHAIEVAWDRGDVEVLDSYFGYTISRQRGKPTNSEFIAMIADKIRLGVIH